MHTKKIRIMERKTINDLLRYGERVNLECKKAENSLPKSVWETYSAFANTNGGYILLGIEENLNAVKAEDRFIICGVKKASQIQKDFWNIINSEKVSCCLLKDEDVEIVQYSKNIKLISIHVPQATYRNRPVYINGNVYKGTFKRNFEGDYHCEESEVKAMIRDSNEDGNDGILIENYTLEDIDINTLKSYRNEFKNRNPEHTYNQLDDKDFLRQFGCFAIDRATRKESLTLAGLLMFGKGLSIRERFSNFRMDYIDLTNLTEDMRYSDRITYDGTWENNLYNFFRRVLTKLTTDLKKPFVLEGTQRKDDTSAHKAIREALTNSIIHADFFLSGSVLRIEKYDNYFCFRNPGTLKLPIFQIYEGGSSKSRNPHIQNLLRMIGFGENLGSGFPTILDACKKEQWRKPDLDENTDLKEVSLKLWMLSMYPTEITDYLRELLGPLFENLSTEDIDVLSIAYVEKEISNQRLQTLLEKNSLEIAKIIKPLTDVELLLSENKGRWTTYKLNKDFQNNITELVDNESTLLSIFSLIKENPYITRKEISEQLNISVTTVQKYINQLKFNNQIKREGPVTRGGYWIILQAK